MGLKVLKTTVAGKREFSSKTKCPLNHIDAENALDPAMCDSFGRKYRRLVALSPRYCGLQIADALVLLVRISNTLIPVAAFSS